MSNLDPSLHVDGKEAFSAQYAAALDTQDPLRHLRKQFLIPSKADLKATALQEPGRDFYPVCRDSTITFLYAQAQANGRCGPN